MIKVEDAETAKEKVQLLTLEVEGYGETAPFIAKSGEITAAAVDSRRDRSGMPIEYKSKRLEDFNWNLYGEDTRAQQKIVKAYIENFNSFAISSHDLYIFSKIKGSGKSMLACCIANEIIEKYGVSVKFITIVDYIELIKDKSEEAMQRRNEIEAASLLILDDLGIGAEKGTWTQGPIFNLINRRYTDKGAVIYTSNIKINDLPYDERIVERVYADGIEIKMPETNIRRKRADEEKRAFMKKVLA